RGGGRAQAAARARGAKGQGRRGGGAGGPRDRRGAAAGGRAGRQGDQARRGGAVVKGAPAHHIPARERVIVALDVPDRAGLAALLARRGGRPAFYKIGLELFIAEGERAVEMVRAHGGRIFLDLKLHDIPETVGRAVASAARIEAELLTVHTSGGFEMLS